MPHAGDWLEGGVHLEAESYTTPVYGAALHEQYAVGDDQQKSFYSVEPAELLYSACKRSENGAALILRVYNTAAHAVDGILKTGFASTARRANLVERELAPALEADDGGAYRFRAGGHEIVTFSITPGMPGEIVAGGSQP